MVQILESAILKKLNDYIYDEFGFSFEFIFSPGMDLLKEYRRQGLSRLDLTNITNTEKILTKTGQLKNFCIWKRTPFIKAQNPLVKINKFDELVIDKPDGTYTARHLFYGESNFSLTFFSTENKILYDLEIFYNIFLRESQPLTIILKFKVDDEIIEIPYNLYFDDISNFDFIDVDTYGGMMIFEINFRLEGLIFSPIFTVNDDIIETLDIKVHSALLEDEITDFKNENLSCENIDANSSSYTFNNFNNFK